VTLSGADTDARKVRLKVLHAGIKRLGIAEDDYRDRLEREFGVRSAGKLSNAQLDRAIAMFHMKQNSALQPHARLVRALWIALANLGAVDPSDTALDRFIERQTGKQKLAFLTSAESNSVTEALKAMCAREGFEVKGEPKGDRQRLLYAIWKKMGDTPRSTVAGDGALSSGHPFALDAYVSRKYLKTSGAVLHLSIDQLDDCAKAFGHKLRRALALHASGQAQENAA
jgi:hypothetical protein